MLLIRSILSPALDVYSLSGLNYGKFIGIVQL